jgi:prepilin-type N-terminal cleavage/methylation domain-containing protein
MVPTHKSSRRGSKGFTLIELLIVVAIIAILAAIAVPNFLEAQTRSKVSRVRADLRSIATALESYRVDNNKYPPTPFTAAGVIRVTSNLLSTPLAYISTANLLDPFVSANLGNFQYFPPSGVATTYAEDPLYPGEAAGDPIAGRRYYYQSNRDDRRSASTQIALLAAIPVEGEWVTGSFGPDRDRDLVTITSATPSYSVLEPYDPTNGTISSGDVVRSQRESQGTIRP